MQASLVKFCGFLFDRRQGTISVNDESIHLEHQQAKILNLLIENRNTIVSRDQIAENVWQGVIVEDNTISKAMTRLRKVLNDSAKTSQIIKTVPKKGYQFIAPLECVNNEETALTDKERKPVRWSAIVVAVTVFIGVVIWLVTTWEHDTQVHSPKSNVMAQATPKPISFREGAELNAHLHGDKTQLLFVGDVAEGYALFTKNIGDANARMLTRVSSQRVYPKWLSGTNSTFIYSDLDTLQGCQIYRVDTKQPTQKDVVAPCLSASPVEVFVDHLVCGEMSKLSEYLNNEIG